MKTLKTREYYKKKHHEWLISAQNHHQTTIIACSVASVMHFDTSFHLTAIYENNIICIFKNINENLKMRTNPLDKLVHHAMGN